MAWSLRGQFLPGLKWLNNGSNKFATLEDAPFALFDDLGYFLTFIPNRTEDLESVLLWKEAGMPSIPKDPLTIGVSKLSYLTIP